MVIFRDPRVDWLGKRWIFIGCSTVLVLAGTVSMIRGGLNLGVDFAGGTLVYAKFRETPSLERIRRMLSEAGLNAESVTRFDEASKNEVQIRMARIESEQVQDLSLEGDRVFEALRKEYDQDQVESGKADLNNISRSKLSSRLRELDAEKGGEENATSTLTERYDDIAGGIFDQRTERGGIFRSLAEIDVSAFPSELLPALKDHFYLGNFTLISVESVGPKVGREMQTRARYAIIFSLIGMLIYIAVRFRLIFGVAAIVALFHDVFITVGLFSLTNKEITLTVIAALLTLVGYSINDTIVIFDRVRENLKLMRRDDLATILNTSINQTLNRTVMTTAMTFLAVFSLFLLGGEVLNGFSFALVTGIIIGTYSTLAIASPIVFWWQRYSEKRRANV